MAIKKLKKSKRKPTKAGIRRKALAAWSKQIRARDGRCIVCGSVDFLQAHHLLPKYHYKHLQYELMNGVTVCPRCHQFGKDSFHQNGIASTLWLQANRQAQYNWVLQQLNTQI